MHRATEFSVKKVCVWFDQLWAPCSGVRSTPTSVAYTRLTPEDATKLEINDHIAASTDAADLEQPLEYFR